MGFTVLIADDEPFALSVISSHIEDDGELNIVSVCKNGNEADANLKTHAPDIAFLKIEMPGMTGLEIANQYIGEASPQIILMSPSEAYACRSFELHVLDYLVNPVAGDRLAQSIARAKRVIAQEKANRLSDRIAELVARYAEESKIEPLSSDECFVTRSGERLNWLETRDIVWIEASNQYLTLHTIDDSFVLSQSLTGFLDEHCSANLCRVHRSHAVNLEAVEEVHRKASGRTEVRLTDGTSLVVSRSRQSVLPTLLKWAHDHKKRRVSSGRVNSA